MSKIAIKPDQPPVPGDKPVAMMVADDLRAVVRDEIATAMKSTPRGDRLLNVEQVCEILNVTDEWVYHHAKKLPFVRKIGGQLRFSSIGLQRYIESAKFTVKDH